MIPLVGSPVRADMFFAPQEGVRRGVSQANGIAASIAQGDVSPENMVGLVEAGIQVKASAAVERAADQTIGTLLDTVA
ncbi:MAG TPA: hypothetical protein VMC06_13840 [Opitutaceae bacterium]|nr:hypothetical protein [Opitutaceae bacterium]